MINPRFQMYSTPRVEQQLQLVNHLLDIYRKVYRLRCIPFIKYIHDVHNGFVGVGFDQVLHMIQLWYTFKL